MQIPPDGPYYDDLEPGGVFRRPPSVTLTDGLAAAYQAIAGDVVPLALDRRLAAAVTGSDGLLADPGLVLHLSIGASTVATKRVIANLFYRNVRLRRPVRLGETLTTTTRVLGLADAGAKPGVKPRGKVLLGITTEADGEVVLEYERCPLLPCRGDAAPGHTDDLGTAGGDVDLDSWSALVPTRWDLAPLGTHDVWTVGDTREDPLRDVVDQATALVRLTHNQAAVHRDADVSPYPVRLVYGGHTVALAQASLLRVLGGVATILGWHACDHVAPVFEGDVLACRHTLVDTRTTDHGTIRAIRVEVTAHRPDTEPVVVLAWVPVVATT